MKEKMIECRFTNAVKDHGGVALKFVSPGQNGVPDRIVLLPDGRTVFVELKAPSKSLRLLQRRWANILTLMGHKHYVIDSYDGIDQFIADVFKGGDAK